jgi:hypothetical protein
MSNSSGSYPTTTEAVMAAYDKLPLLVRMALANALDDYVPQPVLTRHRRGETPVQLVMMVKRWDDIERENHWYRMDRLRERNVDYFTTIRRRKK